MSRFGRTLPLFLASVAAVLAARGSEASEMSEIVSARRDVAIERGAVRLSDLFVGLPPDRDREIGPGPAPGHSIDVPEPQMAAIAVQFDVDWQPDPGFTGMTIRRSGRPVSQAEILAALAPAVAAATGRTDDQITILPFSSPVLPAEFHGAPQVLQLDIGHGGDRFSATLDFAPPDGDAINLRVSGRIDEIVDGLALTRALPAGSVLTPADLARARLHRGSLNDPPLTNPAEVVGLPLARSAQAGTPVSASLLSHPAMVAKNHPVVLRLEQGGLTLTTSGVALEAGTLGGFIHVLNTSSHAVLLGQVMDGTDIRIEPGTTPASTVNGDPSRYSSSSGRMS